MAAGDLNSTLTSQRSTSALISGMVYFDVANSTKQKTNIILQQFANVFISTSMEVEYQRFNISLRMKQSQENNQKNEDYQALINQEYSLVVDGKAADKLVKLFRDYEVDPFTNRIEKVEGAIEKYAHALLINGQYLELTFLIQRYKGGPGEIVKNDDVLFKIGNFGKKEDLQQLWDQTRVYISQLSVKNNLGQRIIEATIDNTIKILAKYFLNYGVEDLTKMTKITEKELVERGVDVRGKFIQLKQEVVQSDCLQSKLKQIAVVASRMSQFE